MLGLWISLLPSLGFIFKNWKYTEKGPTTITKQNKQRCNRYIVLLVFMVNKQGKMFNCMSSCRRGQLCCRNSDFDVFGFLKAASEASVLHPNNKTHHTALCCGRKRLSRNPSENGFLCSSEQGKVCIELLDTFRVTPESFALTGNNRPSVVGQLEQNNNVDGRYRSGVDELPERAGMQL